MNLPSTRPLPVVGAVLAVGLPAVVAVAFAGSVGDGDAPSTRERWGGHGGAPAARTGPPSRVAPDGRWTVAADPRDAGLARGFQRGGFGGRSVRLPYVANAERVTGAAGERAHEGSIAWYRTKLRVPRTGHYTLRFESVNHKAAVWVDGRRVASHVGTYLPFEATVRLAGDREHDLVVRADWRGPEAMKAAGWHRTWFNFGGINREVTIRAAASAELARPAVRTHVDGRTALVELSARVRNHGAARTLRVAGTLRRGGRRIPLGFPAVRVPARSFRDVRTTVRVAGAALWSPRSPALYDLDLRIGAEPAWRTRVGLREIGRRGATLLLNGRAVRLRGASLHEDAPRRGDGLWPGDQDALVRDLRALGSNATRAQHPLSPALLERLDAAGILVWMGIGPVDAPGAWTSKGPRLAAQARSRVRQSVEQLQTHPSILAWNLANEAAGQGHPGGQIPYVEAVAGELRRRDPGRLVALDIWGAHPPRYPGPMYRDIDAIGWTNYIGWYESTYAAAPELRELIRARLAGLRAVFPDKVIAVTEFGAEGNPRNRRGAPGGLDFQARLLRTHLETYAEVPDLAGALIWNLRDFAVAPSFGGGSIREVVGSIDLVRGLNEKGLLTYDGRPKPAARVVRETFARAGG